MAAVNRSQDDAREVCDLPIGHSRRPGASSSESRVAFDPIELTIRGREAALDAGTQPMRSDPPVPRMAALFLFGGPFPLDLVPAKPPSGDAHAPLSV
ncbi:MAG: hypothetical protein DMF78_24235 [Acidobacteria bacterium]|nr:MAG: hypothetical protein DMF78_24235 [Acidobacteriota bacterium]